MSSDTTRKQRFNDVQAFLEEVQSKAHMEKYALEAEESGYTEVTVTFKVLHD